MRNGRPLLSRLRRAALPILLVAVAGLAVAGCPGKDMERSDSGGGQMSDY